MPAGTAKSLAFGLLIFNLVLYGIVSMIAGWAVNHGLETAKQSVSEMQIPVHIFPIYFPFGNMATPFFVIFSLIAGLVGIATSIAGINNVLQSNISNLFAATSTSITTWALTLLAMGLACKEINTGGHRDTNLVALEALTIVLSGTQLFAMGAIHAESMEIVERVRKYGGRV